MLPIHLHDILLCHFLYARYSVCRFITLLSAWCRVAAFVSSSIYSVHCAGLTDFSVLGATRRHFSRQVAWLFRRKFWH
jgi:hypothetical protein